MNFRSCVALAGAFAVFTCFARPAAAQYTVTDIGPNLSYASLNNRGQILAASYDSTTKKNALYLITGSSRELVSANYANAYLNDAGQVAYVENTYPAASPITLYTNGVRTVLSPGGYISGLSDSGNVIWNNNGHGFLYSGGLAHDLGAYTVTAVNNSGQVAGYAVGPHGANAVYLYQNGQWSLAVDAPYYDVTDPYTFQNYTGYQSIQPVALTNNGKIFIESSNTSYSHAAPVVSVYDIPAAKFTTLTSYYSPYVSGYGGNFDGFFFNQRGDYGSSYLTATLGPGRRDLASIVINGKAKDPLAGISSPPQTAGPFILLNSLNNRGQCIYTVSNISDGHAYLLRWHDRQYGQSDYAAWPVRRQLLRLVAHQRRGTDRFYLYQRRRFAPLSCHAERNGEWNRRARQHCRQRACPKHHLRVPRYHRFPAFHAHGKRGAGRRVYRERGCRRILSCADQGRQISRAGRDGRQ